MELPIMNFELIKGRKEKGRTFSETGIQTFLVGVDVWLQRTIYEILMGSFDSGKSVKKMKIKIEFTEIIHGD